MKWLRLMAVAGVASALASAANEPSLTEVRELLRRHLEGVTEADLASNDLPTLLQRFAGRVALVTNGVEVAANTDANTLRLAKAAVFNGRFAYLRLGRVAEGLAGEVEQKMGELAATNKLAGLVLDLRFAGGKDYAEAAAVAGLFLTTDAPLLEWKGEKFAGRPRNTPLAAPLAVLINGRTHGASEAVAAILREHGTAVLIGSPTAGQAVEMTEYRLSTGQTLRLATATLKLGNGQGLSEGRVTPDIVVSVAENEERDYVANPYRAAGSHTDFGIAGATPPGRSKLNEAELVRLKREGLDPDQPREGRLSRSVSPPPKVIQDPVLGRGLDLLTGLNVMKPVVAGRGR